MVGITAWQPAVAFQMIEAQNTGYDARVIDWEASGRQGPKPRWVATYIRLACTGHDVRGMQHAAPDCIPLYSS